MARPREFDFDAALERAMYVFWNKGYEATSLDDLCDATGLSRSSLYATFGNKRDLLLQTVDRYVERRTPNIEAILARSPTIHEGVAALLGEFIDQIVSGSGRRGCFLGNCAAELPRSDRTALARVREGLARTEATFCAALAQAEARGELPPGAMRASPSASAMTPDGLRSDGAADCAAGVLADLGLTGVDCASAPKQASSTRHARIDRRMGQRY